MHDQKSLKRSKNVNDEISTKLTISAMQEANNSERKSTAKAIKTFVNLEY